MPLFTSAHCTIYDSDRVGRRAILPMGGRRTCVGDTGPEGSTTWEVVRSSPANHDPGKGTSTMPAKIVKLETALIARLPQAKGEVWEVGRRRLDVSVAELERQGKRAELLLAVQASGQGGVIQANIVPASAPLTTLGDLVLQGMRQPMIGKPRRPQLIRVSSQAEAAVLSTPLTTVGVQLEVATTLVLLDAVLEEMSTAFGGVAGDYRAHAARTGETLSVVGHRRFPPDHEGSHHSTAESLCP
jgi:uncharacterized protein DUF6930